MTGRKRVFDVFGGAKGAFLTDRSWGNRAVLGLDIYFLDSIRRVLKTCQNRFGKNRKLIFFRFVENGKKSRCVVKKYFLTDHSWSNGDSSAPE